MCQSMLAAMDIQYRIKRRIALGLMLIAAGVLCLSLLGAVAPRIDIFSPFRWHACAATVGALLALAWPRRMMTMVLASALAALVVPVGLAHWRGIAADAAGLPARAPEFAAGTKRTLKIISFNTWDKAANDAEIEAFLRAEHADVVILAEVGPPKQAMLERLTTQYGWQVQCAATWDCALALLSRLPIEASGSKDASRQSPALVWARIGGEAGGLTVIGVHVHRPTRNAQRHLGQIRGLAELTRAVRGQIIVAGDFNAPAWSHSVSWFLQAAQLKPMTRLLPTWPSWPVALPQFALDHVFVSRDVVFESVRTGPASGSDHLPVIATVTVPVALKTEGD